MILDLRDPSAVAPPSCDVCIIGAGAAGITLALELAGSGRSVLLCESGGLTPEAEINDLNAGSSVGYGRVGTSECRLRYLGGTTNHWNGWCRPLEPQDFELRSWVADSGWPFQYSELAARYPRAAEICELPMPPADLTPPAAPAHDDAIVTRLWQFSPPTRFGDVYRQRLETARDVSVVLHASLIRMTLSQDAVTEVTLGDLSGARHRLKAQQVVLAGGAIENARMLLASSASTVVPGNRSGALGRYFMQHPEREVGRVFNPSAALSALRPRVALGTRWGKPSLGLSADEQARLRLLNASFDINGEADRSEGWRALRDVWHDVRVGDWPEDLDEAVGSVFEDLTGFSHDVGEMLRSETGSLRLLMRAEQAPEWSSRVYLGDDRDALGLPRVVVDWQPGETTRRSMLQSTRRLAELLSAADLGRVQIAPWLLEPEWPQPIWGGCHHLGTTRMSDDPAAGVVDRNCRVHGVDNLYVAGSSVFPTGGYAPPTLTIVALALRLADHLRGRGA